MSGGTTEIVLVNKEKCGKYEFEIIGGTKDVSFGQLIDRTRCKTFLIISHVVNT